jgi:hypothetical protein
MNAAGIKALRRTCRGYSYQTHALDVLSLPSGLSAFAEYRKSGAARW